MKGLILKDLYTIKSFARQYGLVLGFMILWAVFMKTVSYIYVFATMMGTMAILSLITVNEAVSFDSFALTMPINVRTLIKEKYLLFIITTSIGILISVLGSFMVILLPVQGFEKFSWREILPVLTVFIVGTSITLPVVFYKGAEKGRYAYIAAMLGLGVVIYVGVKFCVYYHIPFTGFETMPGALYGGVFAVIYTTSIVVSYLVSVRIVQNKQW